MSRICIIRGTMPHKGRLIYLSGLAKLKSGIERYVTMTINRT